jgi:hypothetical protein
LSKISEAELLALPQTMASWSALLKVPVYVRGTWWEKRGGWVGIDYFPPKIGDAKMIKLAGDLKIKNIPLMCEITGFAWQNGKSNNITTGINNMSQAQLDDLKLYFNENNGPGLCEKDAAGKLSDQIIRLCRGTSLGQHFIQDMTSKLFDLGVTAYHHDSDPGMMPDGVTGCFNTAHGHPIPCGPWSTEITRKALLDVKADAERRGISNFLLTKEHCTEQLNMVVHGYISRLSETYKEPYVIPLTQYLYHEYVPVVLYNGQTDELNDIVLLGQFPGGGVFKTVPVVLNDYYGSINSYSRNFLMYGKMLKPMISDIPFSELKVDSDGKEVIINVPHVRQSAWMDESGNIGVFAINTKTTSTTLNVPVPEGVNQASFYLGPSKTSVQTVTPGQTLTWSVTPGRLTAIVFKSSTTVAEMPKRTVSLDIFPNPASDMLHLISPQSNDIQSVNIYSTTGNLVKKVEKMDSMREISVKQLPNGIYLIEVIFKNQLVLKKKFMKN